jgi:uncharacterized SAM-binding protein YcdF (DUF218 family)
VWWAGEQLVVRQAERPRDAIVVFSGDGEAAYVNNSYQKRAQDALRLYRAGYGERIVLSSGKGQTFSETEVIRSLLMTAGVPGSAITLVEGVPSSTRENVLMTAATLKSLGLRKALFVTAPYHSRRATLVWNRLAPEIDLVVAPALDTPSTEPVWNIKGHTARVIGFEYSAIVYYWLRGWV